MTEHRIHRARTLFLVGALHAFTHLYQVVLLPLYLLVQKDLHLEGIEQATLLSTAMLMAYFVPSYPMGILADKLSRRMLLTVGLAINASAFIALSFCHSYSSVLACVILSGIGGSFYHPAATALVARLCPHDTGHALGMVGIGAGVGFFIGPIYSGWRATSAGWRAPVIELGIIGLVAAALFYWLCDEERNAAHVATVETSTNDAPILGRKGLWAAFFFMSFAFSLRDFAGTSMGTLGSLFLQKANGMDLISTGRTISAIFLAAAISNPVFGRLSDSGLGRYTTTVLILAGIGVALFPHLNPHWSWMMLAFYGFFFMASYPMIEAALMKGVPDAGRGRVFGLFISLCGFVGNLSHWMMGRWVRHLGDSAAKPESYYPIYYLLALMIICSVAGLPILKRMVNEQRSRNEARHKSQMMEVA